MLIGKKVLPWCWDGLFWTKRILQLSLLCSMALPCSQCILLQRSMAFIRICAGYCLVDLSMILKVQALIENLVSKVHLWYSQFFYKLYSDNLEDVSLFIGRWYILKHKLKSFVSFKIWLWMLTFVLVFCQLATKFVIPNEARKSHRSVFWFQIHTCKKNWSAIPLKHTQSYVSCKSAAYASVTSSSTATQSPIFYLTINRDILFCLNSYKYGHVRHIWYKTIIVKKEIVNSRPYQMAHPYHVAKQYKWQVLNTNYMLMLNFTVVFPHVYPFSNGACITWKL